MCAIVPDIDCFQADRIAPDVAATVRNYIKKWDAKCEQAKKTDNKGWTAYFDALPWYNFLAFE